MSQKSAIVLLLAAPGIAILTMAMIGPPPVLVVLGFAALFTFAVVMLGWQARSDLAARLMVTLLVVGVSCFVATMAEELALGGTPLNGKKTEEGYFVGSHGHYARVSEAVYRFSLLPDLGLLVFWPSLLAFGIVSDRRKIKRSTGTQR